MTPEDDTIVALATPPGRGGVGIVRVSGPGVPQMVQALFGVVPPPRKARLVHLADADGAPIDHGLLLVFVAPHSFTGEHVFEFQGHGGPVVMQLAIERFMELGARLAEPGEFSRRAFLNDRLDLAQAEAIADLIASGSAQAARAALRSLEGEFSAAVHQLTELLTQLRMYVEAAIDFPEEEIDFLTDHALADRVQGVAAAFDDLTARAEQGRLLADGITVVIAGRPNAGKSSLLNALAGTETAIVTDIPGTTRDLLRETMVIDGLAVHLTDTAGLRADADRIEAEGIRRARATLATADHALLLLDAADESAPRQAVMDELRGELPADLGHTVVLNKVDLSAETAGATEDGALNISAKTGAGLDALRDRLRALAGTTDFGEGALSARRRHLEALAEARARFDAGREHLETRRAGELMAEELRQAQMALGRITGEFTSDDLLGRIFSSFCIGK
ncbi:tRNA uridine-5-carboxymethylaminomethyl(34) synthesis GTPase MnmE [Lentisalinibacter orientalis]|uniref:tRNA uridine-5-carboxymethylaminomethyl(34) synthesis GTPase MnmE n=1 Tax=Lentisalinibacter orientalis TaxID=2992241 RepID=UPI00386D83AC